MLAGTLGVIELCREEHHVNRTDLSRIVSCRGRIHVNVALWALHPQPFTSNRLKVRAYRVQPSDWPAFRNYLRQYSRQDDPPVPPGQQVMDKTVELETEADAFETIEVPDGEHELSLRIRGGSPILYGMVLERDGPGVVYDSNHAYGIPLQRRATTRILVSWSLI